MDAETRMEQQRILAARDSEFVFGEGGVADQIQAELVLRAEGWERSWRTADAEREALARLHEEATENAARYLAVIEKANRATDSHNEREAGGWQAVVDRVQDILGAADAAAVLRERDAEKWDEGYEVGRHDEAFEARGSIADPVAHEYPHENPYREGADRG